MQGHICEAAKAKHIGAAKYGYMQRTIKSGSHKNTLKVLNWKYSPGNIANFIKCKSTERKLMADVIGCSLHVLGQQLCGTDLPMPHIPQLLNHGYCCCRLIKGLKSDPRHEAEYCMRSESSQCDMMWGFKHLSHGFLNLFWPETLLAQSSDRVVEAPNASMIYINIHS